MSVTLKDFSISSYLLGTNQNVDDEQDPRKVSPHIVLKISDQRVWIIRLSKEYRDNEITIGDGESDSMLKCKFPIDKLYLVHESLQTVTISHYSELKNCLLDESKSFLINYIIKTYFTKHQYYSGLAMKCSRIPVDTDSKGSCRFCEQVVIIISARIHNGLPSFTVCPVYSFKNSINSVEIKFTNSEFQPHDDSTLFSRFPGLNDLWIDLTQLYTYSSVGMCNGTNILESFQDEPRLLNSSMDLVIDRLQEILLQKIPNISSDSTSNEGDDLHISDINTFLSAEVDWREEIDHFYHKRTWSSTEEDFSEECLCLTQFVEDQRSREVLFYHGYIEPFIVSLFT